MKLLFSGALLIALAIAMASLRRSALEDNQVRWSNMQWESYTLNGNTVDHAALMVDVQLDGSPTRMRMQLDLGTPSTVVYSSQYARLRGDRKAAPNWVLENGTLANRHFRDEPFSFLRVGGEPGPGAKELLGSIGANFFERRILILDFVRQRLAILGRGAALPMALQRDVEYLPLKFQYGHVIVSAMLDGRELPNLMFDTGSSMTALVTGRTHWMEWTHRQPTDPANITIRANSWGKQAVGVGAPINGTLCFGSACLVHPLVYFESSGLKNMDFDSNPSVAAALFGNVVFDGRFTVIVDIPGHRFGLLRGSPAS